MNQEQKELLLRVKETILEEPKKLAMSDWVQRKSEKCTLVTETNTNTDGTKHRFADCGTAACIGGWAVILHAIVRDGVLDFGDLFRKYGSPESVLGLLSFQENKLFYVSEWDSPYYSRYTAANNPEARAIVAAEYIDHFLEKYADLENDSEEKEEELLEDSYDDYDPYEDEDEDEDE